MGRSPLEVRYTSLSTPIGTVFVAASETGLVRVAFGLAGAGAFRRLLEQELGGACRRDDRGLESVRRTLRSYFAGRAPRLDFRLDLRNMRPFQRRVLEALRRVPYGQVVSYGELARAAGSPGAARAVGQALGRNPLPIILPCHRVVARGGIGGFTGGLRFKRALLGIEQVPRRGGPARALPGQRARP